MEIERKWLVNNFPNGNFKATEEYRINQWYLSINPEVRVKSKTNLFNQIDRKYDITIKGNGEISRTETEIKLTCDQYESICADFYNYGIKKEYKKYRIDGEYDLEVSCVDDLFYYAEIEFDSEEEAKEFVMPKDIFDFVIDITYDSLFKMKNYYEAKSKEDLYKVFLKHINKLYSLYNPEIIEYRNKKNGNIYTIINKCVVNCTNEQDGQRMILYKNPYGDIFCRESKEFFEKFEPYI